MSQPPRTLEQKITQADPTGEVAVAASSARRSLFVAPNLLTVTRLGIAVPFFVCFYIGTTLAYDIALGLILLSSLTDILDGWVARRLRQQTDFGRVADPLIDKVIMCGALIFLAAAGIGVPAWMVVVIVGREFIIHGLRSYIEAHGRSYGATFIGKQKIVFEFAAVCGGLIYAAHFQGERWAYMVMLGLIWLTLLSAVVSGIIHFFKAWPILKQI